MKIIHPIPAQRNEPQNVSGNFNTDDNEETNDIYMYFIYEYFNSTWSKN
jgi:hypothetical protein